MLTPQTTINTTSDWICGLHLDQDASSRVRFLPSADDTGITFIRADLPGRPEVRCVPENLQSMPRWTALAKDGNWVHHTEHILAAIALCGVDNVLIEMDADRIPMMPGGTCELFVEALLKAGSKSLGSSRKVYRLKGPAYLMDSQSTDGKVLDQPPLRNGRYVIGAPADFMAVSTVFHWSHRNDLPLGVAEYELSAATPDPLITQARSYLIESEKALVKNLLGPVQDNVMMLSPGCPQTLAIEAARHKIVDFIGDMMILGRPLHGRFAAFRTGHRIHHDLVRHLLSGNLLEIQTV